MPSDPARSFASAPSLVNLELGHLTRRHLQFGWWSLLVFLTLGIGLEALHGFKAGLYLNVSNEMRRLMWTLAHAHGTLLALAQIAFAVTLPHAPAWPSPSRLFASRCLQSASVLLPGGFFLGGLDLHGADPGLGIVLVPIGALLCFTTVFLTARALRGMQSVSRGDQTEPGPVASTPKRGTK